MGNRCQQCAKSNAINEKKPCHDAPIVPPLDRKAIPQSKPAATNIIEAAENVFLEPEFNEENLFMDPGVTGDDLILKSASSQAVGFFEIDKIVEPESTRENLPSDTLEKLQPRVSARVLQAIHRLSKAHLSEDFVDEGTIPALLARPTAPPLMVPPMETVCEGSMWNIKGIYEHQALKVGLRRLDQTWAGADVYQFPTGRGALLKERLFKSLLAGEMQFQSVLGAEIAAAQSDIPRLSLVQLLRLRVILLDFVPSVSGHNCNGACEAFIRSLDGTLFQKLGQQIACGDIVKVETSSLASVGREAILMVAAAGAVTSSCWWAWWVPGSDRQKVFFNAQKFAIVDTFPVAGVLERVIYSKPDVNDATGQFWWMDWQIKLVAKEGDLNTAPLSPRNGSVANLVCLDTLRSGRARLKSSAPQ